jgi:acyl-CoA hydrolase
MRGFKSFLLFSFVVVLALQNSTASAQNFCANLFLSTEAAESSVSNILRDHEALLNTDPATIPVIETALAMATENKWPVKVIAVGPVQRKVQRIFIGIDRDNAKDMQTYRDAFLPNKPLGGVTAGVLPLEFQHEPKAGTRYVYGFLRMTAGANDRVYRYARPDENLQSIWRNMNSFNTEPINHYASLIGMTEAERKNFEFYISNPGERGACKMDNCIAWTSSIELGKTGRQSSTEDRKHLLPVLGVSRSYDPQEISRRLIHAANERHRVVFVFYRGAVGKESFENLAQNIVREPQIPYTSIIKDLPQDTEVLKKALSVIPDGGKVFFPIAAGASPEGFQGLMEYSKGLKNGVDIHVLVNGISEAVINKGISENPGKARIHALFLGGNLRKLYREGKVSVIPGYLADFPKFVKMGLDGFAYDAIVVRVSPADAHGNHSLGPNSDMIMTILAARPEIKIIAEINKNVPYLPQGAFINKAKFASSFISDAPLAGPVSLPMTTVEENIGENLSQLIPSGSFLQVGIGNIFTGLPGGFQRHNIQNIKIWTEMFGDQLMDLVNQGRVTSAVASFAFGSKQMYEWLNQNQRLTLRSTIEVNDPGAVSNMPSFHAVNTALQVNLRGDANATHGPEGRISSPGGQVEFMSGAARSMGGKAIIAIRSTAKDGTISAISLDNYQGAITTPHESVTHVVTEYGIADLRGKDERSRALSLIRIAHPNFRLMLAQGAVQRGLIFAADVQEFTEAKP